MEGINSLILFLQAHYLDLAAVVVFVLLGFLLWKNSPSGRLYVSSTIRELVAVAEFEWMSKQGKTKFAQVYNRLPFIVRLVFSQKKINDLVEVALKELREELDKVEQACLAEGVDPDSDTNMT